MEQAYSSDKRSNILIGVLSIAIPVVVAVLLFLPQKVNGGNWARMLPHLNALINSLTSVVLIMGLVFIKKGKINLHRICMTTAFSLGALFLVSYVLYHAAIPSTVYGDVNGNNVLDDPEKAAIAGTVTIYYILLATHIFMAAIVLPFVLRAMYFAWKQKFDRHRKVVKWAFPIWLYVSITGVIVYFMISPYYAF